VIAAALRLGPPIVALHLTRPAIPVPDRDALGSPPTSKPRGAPTSSATIARGRAHGCVVVQGTSTTNNLLSALPELDRLGLNVKIVAAISPQLFRAQPEETREKVLSAADRADIMGITNRSRQSLGAWLGNEVAFEYSLCADWDDRWRTGGTVDEVLEEAHLSADWILQGSSVSYAIAGQDWGVCAPDRGRGGPMSAALAQPKESIMLPSRSAAGPSDRDAFVVLAEVADLESKGKKIVSFCIGQPDFPSR